MLEYTIAAMRDINESRVQRVVGNIDEIDPVEWEVDEMRRLEESFKLDLGYTDEFEVAE